MSRILGWLRNEPVGLLTTAAGAVIGVLSAFGISVTTWQKSAVLALIVALVGLVARQTVTPTSKKLSAPVNPAVTVQLDGEKVAARVLAGLRTSRLERILEPHRPPAAEHLALLPAAGHRKGGALPSPRDDRDWRAKLPRAIPHTVDFTTGISFPMLLNDRIGDCYPAALLHALQVLTGGEYVPTDAQVLYVYEQVTGYDPRNPNSDQGTAGRPLFKWAKANGLITSYAAVPVDRKSIRAAIAAHKAVLCEWALPSGCETEGDIWTVPRSGRTPGSWGGHATVEAGYTATRNRNVTWGEVGTVTGAFEDDYLQAAWVVTAPITIPSFG